MKQFIENIDVYDEDLAVEIAVALAKLVDDEGNHKYEIIVKPSNDICDKHICKVAVYKNIKV
jgi:hypothetical protein